MVMEFVDGENLQQLVSRRGAILSVEAVPIFKQALLGIGAAHRMGIVHRDVKPANIMINRQGVVKVMDFGIAKVVGERGLTRTGTQLGTVFYMSPEQVKGNTADVRSDIYALGVTLYEVLTGHVPFNADSEFDVLTDHVNTPPPLLSIHGPNIPRGIENIVLKALEKRPEDRFQTVDEFAAALDHPEQWEHYVPRSTMVVPAGMAPTAEIETGHWKPAAPSPPMPSGLDKTLPPPAPKSFWTGPRAFTASLLGVLALGLVGVLALKLTPGKPTPAPVTKSAPAVAVPSSPKAAAAQPAIQNPAATPPPSPEVPAAAAVVPAIIPETTTLAVQLTGAVDGSLAGSGETFPATIAAPVIVGGKPVLARGADAQVRLVKSTKAGRFRGIPKMEFELSSIFVDGKNYKVHTDKFELAGPPRGKKTGKLGGLGTVFGGMVHKNNPDDEGSTFTVPPETVMTFKLRAPVSIGDR
jgi:hypothetical protein